MIMIVKLSLPTTALRKYGKIPPKVMFFSSLCLQKAKRLGPASLAVGWPRIGTNCAHSRLFLTSAIAVSFPSIIYRPSCLSFPFPTFAKVPEVETRQPVFLETLRGCLEIGLAQCQCSLRTDGGSIWESAGGNTDTAVTALDHVSL